MVRTIRPIGNSHGLIIDKAILDLLGLQAGSTVDVSLAPGGKGILLTPLGDDAAQKEHKKRVQEAHEKVLKAHRKVFKRLAE